MPDFKLELPQRKIGRNEICPCGSKKKFKRCHGSTSPPPQPQPGQIDAFFRTNTPKAQCLAPSALHANCAGGVITAHTISRSGSLGIIARANHVYSYRPSVKNFEETDGEFLPTLTGWKLASTFPGFCSNHDTALFAPLETETFTASAEQCFLLAYRAVSREYYAKLRSVAMSDYRTVLTRGGPFAEHIAAMNAGTQRGLADGKDHKDEYDRVLMMKDWRAVRAVVVTFSGTFPIQCAGSIFPERNIRGLLLQNLDRPSTPDLASLISFAADGVSYFALVWLERCHKAGSALAASLLAAAEAQLPPILASLLLQSSENCHFSPDWYDGLGMDGKEWCATQVMHGVAGIKVRPPIDYATAPFLAGVSVSNIARVNW